MGRREGGSAYRSSTPSRARATTGASPSPTTFPTPTAAASRATSRSSTTTATLVGTAGHLHPGGLWTTSSSPAPGARCEVFRSRRAILRAGGRGVLGRGDDRHAADLARRGEEGRRARGVGHLRLAHDLVVRVDGHHAGRDDDEPAGGADPFTTNDAVKGVLTHGHLRENDHHGGAPGTLPDATKLPDGPRPPTRRHHGFAFGQGDLSSTGPLGRPPVVQSGPAADLRQRRRRADIFHTITACRAPCTATTGIAFPLANGAGGFDSGELGFGRPASPRPPTARRGRPRPT